MVVTLALDGLLTSLIRVLAKKLLTNVVVLMTHLAPAIQYRVKAWVRPVHKIYIAEGM